MAAVVVLGGGLAGLAAAARTARQRHDVTLLDVTPSGDSLVRPAEPASFTLPAVYRDLFRKTGRPLENHVRLVAVDPARRYVFPDGRVLDLPTGSRGAMLDAFGRALGPAAASEWDGLVAWGGELWADLRHRVVPAGEAPQSSGRSRAPVRLRDPANRLVLDWYAIDAGADTARTPAGLASLAAAIAERAARCGATLLVTSDAEVLVQDGKVTGVRVADGSTMPAEVVVDSVGRPLDAARKRRTSPALTNAPAIVTVHLQAPEPPDLPVETVLLPARGGLGVVVVRPDATGATTSMLVRATVPTTPRPDEQTELVRRLLEALRNAGVQITGEVVGVSVEPAPGPARLRRWPRKQPADWLDLRAELAEPDASGLVRAATQIRGGLAVPWQGLAAALAASSCGTVPRHRSP